MVTYVYHIFGENRYCDYENKQIQINSKAGKQTRAYLFNLLINQTFISIQTLRLFDKTTKIIILTNQPTHLKFISILELKILK